MGKLEYIPEPLLKFGFDQDMEHPRDGLSLFGPHDSVAVAGVRPGVIGTRRGLSLFKEWVTRIQSPVGLDISDESHPFYPGFEATFRIPWNPQPSLELFVSDEELERAVHLDSRNQRVYQAVDLFSSRIVAAMRQEESSPQLWFIIIPDVVRDLCRPQSVLPATSRIVEKQSIDPQYARSLLRAPSLFSSDNQAAIPYHYEPDFHNQLKAKILGRQIPTQIIRESTLAAGPVVGASDRDIRTFKRQELSIAWNISSATFYKLGGRPWKLANIREGVCYIGLVFKRDVRSGDERLACSAAQMFLDSGDGMIFRGDVGPWYSPKRGEFHLDLDSATDLIAKAMQAYRQKRGKDPNELFIHGRTEFTQQEWKGFAAATSNATNLVGVRISGSTPMRLYRKGSHPVMRGTAAIFSKTQGLLWSKGFVPRLATYPGMEVPKPLSVVVTHGEADIAFVLADILALTKLNYNSSTHSDGLPVTLTFADTIGEILTAGPLPDDPPLPFKFYI